MDRWITLEIAQGIIAMIDLLAKNRFDILERNDAFEISTSAEIKNALLEYLCGDLPDERALSRIGTPDLAYLEQNADLYEIAPRQPAANAKRVEIDLIVDGVPTRSHLDIAGA